MRARGDQDGVARPGDGRHRGVKALRGSAGHEPAEVGIPRLCSDLMRTLEGEFTLGTIVEALRRQHIGVEDPLAEQCLHTPGNYCALVVAGRPEADDRPLLDCRQRIGQRRNLLIHA